MDGVRGLDGSAGVQPAGRIWPRRTRAAAQPTGPLPQREAIDRYCVTCHNQRLKTADLALDTLDLAKIAETPDTWEKVVRKLRTGTMPPLPSRRPDHATYQGLIRFLEGELDRAAAATPNPGRPVLHRLNRAEYANAIHDVLALDVDAASLLPPDDSAYGFDNISDVLGVSPSLQERYLTAARKISALAVGDPDVAPGSDTFVIRQDLSQNQHIDGLPLGTVGGLRVRHTFPLDGEYTFQVKLYRTNLNIVRGLEYPHQMEFTVDGERDSSGGLRRQSRSGGAVREADRYRRRGRSAAARPRTDQGRARTSSRWRSSRNRRLQDTVRLQGYLRSSADNFDWSGRPHMQTLAITGPFNADGSGRHAEPPADFHLPAGVAGGGARLRPPDPLDAGAPRLSQAGDRCRPAAGAELLRNRPRPGAGSSAASRWACSASSPARSSCSASSAIPRTARRARSTASATSSWRRACRSSSGAASPTMSC